MIGNIQLKMCGMTRVEDARVAADAGADFLGFIFYPKSPRGITLEEYKAMGDRLPELPHVAVLVNPDADSLKSYFDAGLDKVQIHFEQEDAIEKVKAWSAAAGAERLWLVPKIKPVQELDPAFLPFTTGILWDGYKKDLYGGTGKTSDWKSFSQLKTRHSEQNWILSGGLGPDNVAAAITESGARIIDLSSGVEQSPGIKDPSKVEALNLALQTLR